MIWSNLRSHTAQMEMLRRSIRRGRLAHTYLFSGPAGIGKSLFARIFAQCLLCERTPDEELEACGECPGCRQMKANTHPDFFYVGCPEGKQDIPVELFKGEKEKRNGLIHDLALRPMVANRRVAIIDDANRMNDEGANAMLKTLEEPPADSLLILIAENLDPILPTIRSRCQLIRFSPLPENDVAELQLAQIESRRTELESEFLDWRAKNGRKDETKWSQFAELDELRSLTGNPDFIQSAAALSEGSLQTAQQLLNLELRDLREKLHEFLAAADLEPLAISRVMTAGVESLSGNTQEQRRNARWLIRFTQEFYRQAALILSGSSPASVPRDVETFCRRRKNELAGTELAMALFDIAVTAENRIGWNVNPLRTLEALFDELSRETRTRQTVSGVAKP